MYSRSTAARWRGPVIRSWSRHSRRSVPIQRSAIAFARGARIGVRMMRMSAPANTASKPAGELAVPVADQEPELLGAVAEVHEQGAAGRGWGGSRSVGLRRRCWSVRATGFSGTHKRRHHLGRHVAGHGPKNRAPVEQGGDLRPPVADLLSVDAVAAG